MPTTAFNPRGTSGSGKTTIARAILEEARAKPIVYSGKKVRMYEGELYGVPLYLIGDYGVGCGGCDTIPKVGLVAAILVDLMDDPSPKMVVYEGLMISHMIGTVGGAMQPYGDRHVMGFLDTPLKTCLERVRARRLGKGNVKPFNPDNTIKDYGNVLRCRANALAQGFRVVDIDHTDAIAKSFGVLRDLSEIARATALDTAAGTGT